jgi:hypothetical protein
MITDGRAQGLGAAGFPVGCPSPGAPGQVSATPAPATSNRACGSPAHGLPTPFTAGIRFLPPGLVGPGCNDGPTQAVQRASVRRLVGEHGQAEAASAFVPFADEQCEPIHGVLLNVVEADRGVAVAEIVSPATQEPVQVLHDYLDRQQQSGADRQLGDPVPGTPHCPITGPAGEELHTASAVDAPRAHHPVMKAKKVEAFSAHHQFDDAGLGLFRREAEVGQQRPQPCERGLGLLPGFAYHQQIVGEAHQHPVCAGVPSPVEPVQVHVAHQGADHAPNAMGNFCFDATLGYRRLERPRRVPGGS